jgi:hypothetical protein
VFIGALAVAPAAFAQKWEFGGGVGGGFYTSGDIANPAGNVSGKFSSNVAASAWLANNSGPLLGGELRYDYQRGNAVITGAGQSATFGAQSQAVHYDFLLHLAPRSSPVRPFVAAGGGVKVYQGTGAEVAFQPLSRIALLTKTNDLKPLVSVGAGIKFNVSKAFGFRAEIHDFLTPFPDKVIAPALNSKTGGWLNDFVVSFGISVLF